MAEGHARKQFEKFEVTHLKYEAQQSTSDFDYFVEKTKKIKIKAVKALPEGKKAKAKTKRKGID